MAKKQSTANYKLVKDGKVVYYGITKNLQRRAEEHRDTGKKFDRIEQIGRKKVPSSGKAREEELINRFRSTHGGRRPRYNKDDDG